MQKVVIDKGLCDDCHTCVEECPVDVIGEVGGKTTVLNPQDCMACAFCETACPRGAIKVMG